MYVIGAWLFCLLHTPAFVEAACPGPLWPDVIFVFVLGAERPELSFRRCALLSFRRCALPVLRLEMAAIHAAAILAPAADVPAEPVEALSVREMLRMVAPSCTGRRNGRTKQLRAKSKRKLGLQQRAQVRTFAREGLARTADHCIMAVGAERARVKGSSGWRKWTAEAVLKASAANPMGSSRSAAPRGGSHNSAHQCGPITAECIVSGVEKGLDELKQASGKRKFVCYLTGNMADETKLPFSKPRSRKRRCLAWHSQVSWMDGGGEVRDLDVVRSPAIVKAYNAAIQWQVMAREGDIAGLRPCAAALPDAEFYGSTFIGDSHSVNKLCSKFAATDPRPNFFHAGSWCQQHRAGSVSEAIGERMGFLPASLCLATQMEQGDFYDELEESVTAVLVRYLVCVYGAATALGPEDLRLCMFARELLRICHVGGISRNDHEETDEDVSVGQEKREREANAFLKFFPPPWTGVLNHACTGDCCEGQNRQVSVREGTRHIMTVVLPHLTRPAANRYTKVFPVVVRLTLMHHFYQFCKKAFRRQLNDQIANSDDEAVLANPNALVGAPDDPVNHYRRLQACGIDEICMSHISVYGIYIYIYICIVDTYFCVWYVYIYMCMAYIHIYIIYLCMVYIHIYV